MQVAPLLDQSNVAVLIPARDEVAAIRAIAKDSLTHAQHVIVIDDASSDGTSEVLRDLPITLLRSDTRLGKGGALAWGFKVAAELGASAVITLDGDGQHDPADIPAFIAAANSWRGCLILGARLKQVERAPWRRRLANRIADFWISWAAGQPIRDSQCGQRLYPAELLQAVQLDTQIKRGFVFESEILIEGVLTGFNIVSLPIESRYPPHARASHFHPVQDIWRITRMVSRKILLQGLRLQRLAQSLRLPVRVVERV